MAGELTGRVELKRRLRELTRINQTLLEVTQAIINAETAEELEQTVCERLAAAEPYRLAWIGELDPETGDVTPRAAAGVDSGYLAEIDINIDDDGTGRGPTAAAIRTRTPQVMQDIPNDPAFEPWRDAALARGYQSSAAFPMISGDDLYGVLNIYADRPDAFTASEVDFLSAIAVDITFAIRHHQAQAELEQQRDLLAIATAAGEIGVWSWYLEDDTVVCDRNWERLFGIEPGAFEGSLEAVFRRIKPEDRASIERALDLAVATKDRYEREYRIVRDDGVERWLLGLGNVLLDDQGEPERVVGVNVDITDRKNRAQHLRVLDRVLRHNIRTTLNLVSGHAELILEQSTGEVVDSATKIIESSEDLLDTAEKERRVVEILTEQPERLTVDIVTIVDGIVETMQARHPAATVAYHGPPAATATVPGDSRTALEELVENAIIHNDRPAPRVTVEVEPLADRLQIRVRDNGPGIPEMNIGVLTGEGDIEPLYHGSGLGLWLVHWIVRRGDGDLRFEANEPRGNVVTATFPTAHAAGASG